MDSKDYAWKSAREIAAGVRAKKFSAEDVAKAALRRIHDLNPSLQAFIQIFDDRALEQARQVDARIAAGDDPGKLAGVPIALKDNLCLDGTRVTCASKMLENFVSPYTATAVRAILDQGAVPMGKTNLDEFAMGSSTENSAFALTRNPWNTDRVPGGSSGGSAVAVASGMVPLSLGSDTGGSIRQPASFTGVLGLKPTYGRISRYGLVAFASSLDQIGPFARDAADAALLTAALAEPDVMDATHCGRAVPGDLWALDAPENLHGLKLGVPKEYFVEGMDSEVEARIREAIERLRGLGAEIVEISLPHTAYGVAVYYVVATAEASSNLSRYDGMHYGHRTDRVSGLVDTYMQSRSEGFGDEVKRRIMLGTYTLSSGYFDAYYLKAQKVRGLIKGDFDAAWAKVDAIVAPTSPTTAFGIGEKANDPLSMYLSDIFTITANLATVPALSLPCGFSSEGLPVGLQLMGRPFDELGLLRLASAFQANTEFHLRHPPSACVS